MGDDFEKVGAALARESSYVASLALEEFYRNIRSVGVSAVTGQGCDDFERALAEAAVEFHNNYVPFLMEQRRDIEEKRNRIIEEQIKSFESSKAGAQVKRSRNGDEMGSDDDPEMDELEGGVRDFTIHE